MFIDPLTAIDFYKADHRRQYPEGTQYVYSNFTPRSNKHAPWTNRMVFFGLQFFIKDFLEDAWNRGFFGEDKDNVVSEYERRMDNALGPDAIPVEHIEELHDLGYLPIKIKALPEGSKVPMGVPALTIVNTHPKFFWLTNYLESVMSAYLWRPCTSATIAHAYRTILDDFAVQTGGSKEFVPFQGHDFSFRGMAGVYDAQVSGAAHLTSFVGTDTVGAIDFLETYYNANSDEELIGCSVPATEHSVMCMGTQEGEFDTFKRLITEQYPNGIVSIVSDTWDFWKVVTEYLPALKKEVMERDGKVVIRPDSGDPVYILCGDPTSSDPAIRKGLIECLWDIFGGTTNEAGFRTLDPHIGAIYGDSITLDRARSIMQFLYNKGFTSDNVVFGIGSYTYQYNTRDTFGMAMKATSGVVNGERRDIFKDPKTDDGTKKSARGLLRVEQRDGIYVLYDQQTEEQEERGMLETVYQDGRLLREHTLQEIRDRILNG